MADQMSETTRISDPTTSDGGPLDDASASDAASDAAASDAGSDAAASLHPYRDRFDRYDRMPPKGRDRADILDEMRAMRADEESRWADGFASGSVYHGDPDHIAFLNEAYAINSQANPLHADLWPSVVKFEAEIVAMTADMVGGGPDGVETVCGSVSSGGTDSILLAMKVYRDRGRLNGITQPNLVVATSAHAAFEKACQYFAMELRKVPVAADGRADVEAMIAAVDDSTIALVGSAPCFPTGLIDPIEELAAAAAARGIGFHTDCCLGGFLLPWAERLGYPVPPFDFRVPGVTSISCDTHKYGYAAKGTSVVLYRTPELRHLQYYTTASWAGGLYYSPTFAGSRPGALSAACWAAMVSLGEEGYLDAASQILETAAAVKAGVALIDGLEVVGDPLWNVAIRSTDPEVNIYAVLEQMGHRRWSLNGLLDPPSLHLCTTLRHTADGVVERFLADLGASVDAVRSDPDQADGLIPVYGLASMAETQDLVAGGLLSYVDGLYEV